MQSLGTSIHVISNLLSQKYDGNYFRDSGARVSELVSMGFLLSPPTNVMEAISVAQACRVSEQISMAFLISLQEM